MEKSLTNNNIPAIFSFLPNSSHVSHFNTHQHHLASYPRSGLCCSWWLLFCRSLFPASSSSSSSSPTAAASRSPPGMNRLFAISPFSLEFACSRIVHQRPAPPDQFSRQKITSNDEQDVATGARTGTAWLQRTGWWIDGPTSRWWPRRDATGTVVRATFSRCGNRGSRLALIGSE